MDIYFRREFEHFKDFTEKYKKYFYKQIGDKIFCDECGKTVKTKESYYGLCGYFDPCIYKPYVICKNCMLGYLNER